MPGSAPFDARRIFETLCRHNVRFVLIGGLAANVLGSPSVTNDAHICYDCRDDNLEALAAALNELRARLRGAPKDLPFRLDALTLKRGDSFTFATDAGAFDILGTPSGVYGFDELMANAQRAEVFDVEVWVCALSDLIRMKTAAGRPKDRIELTVLYALRDEIEGQPE
jgi:hypothetical protein